MAAQELTAAQMRTYGLRYVENERRDPEKFNGRFEYPEDVIYAAYAECCRQARPSRLSSEGFWGAPE